MVELDSKSVMDAMVYAKESRASQKTLCDI